MLKGPQHRGQETKLWPIMGNCLTLFYAACLQDFSLSVAPFTLSKVDTKIVPSQLSKILSLLAD